MDMFIYAIQQIYYACIVIIFLYLHQKLTFNRMSTPQCHEINVMTFDAECHEIWLVGRKTNVMTLMSWDLENVMSFIFSGTGASTKILLFAPTMAADNTNMYHYVISNMVWACKM